MFLQRMSKVGMDSSPYYQSKEFNHAKGTINDLPNCTQFCICRTYESTNADKPFVMFYGKSAGGYYTAKQWYEKTTLPKGTELKTGSIAVFDGNYGHVAFVEQRLDSNHALISQSQYDDNKSLRNYKYYESRECELTIGKATLSGVGKLIGFIYLPIDDIRAERNVKKEQVKINESMVNVRVEPDGDLVCKGCYAPIGIYNVVKSKKVGEYTWYCIEKNHWVREGSWLEYLPKETTNAELVKEVEELKKVNDELSNELAIAYDRLEQVRNIVK